MSRGTKHVRRIQAGRYEITDGQGVVWVIRKRDTANLGGWKWMSWHKGSRYGEGPAVFGDTLRDMEQRILNPL